jgi:hypothetical protein
MPTDLVIIPCFERPEFTWLCLENLYENVRGTMTDKEIWICEDIHADKPKGFTIEMEMLAVMREWERKMHLFYYATAPHTTYGNSYNVLRALTRAASRSVRQARVPAPAQSRPTDGVHRCNRSRS